MRPAHQFLCVDCEHIWRTAFRAERPEVCPRCGSPCFGRLTWSEGDGPEGRQRRGARRTGRPAGFLDAGRGFGGAERREHQSVG